jgi:hypothetical protein
MCHLTVVVCSVLLAGLAWAQPSQRKRLGFTLLAV